VRLGLDTYSLRWQGWDAFQMLEYAAALGLDNVQFSERGTLASLERPYLEFSSCFRAEYGAAEQQLAEMLAAAATLASPILRCVLGAQKDRLGPLPFQAHVDEFARVLNRVGGAMVQWVPLGQGSVDLRAIYDVLCSTAPGVAFNLEIITGDQPVLIPYADADSDFWRAYPDMLARDFVQFLGVAQRGPAGPLDQLTLPLEARAPAAGQPGQAMRDQQRRHLEQSVVYARDVLGAGQRILRGQP
jgi:hypothetical protein